ncbi:MAG: 2-oxo acid dehydrogenase subunit E2 [Calditrichaceae bacterium]
MKKINDTYKIVKFPKVRHVYVELLRRGNKRNTIHAFIDIDVTTIRNYIQKVKEKTGQSLSLTAYIAYCLGQALNNHKYIQAYRKGLSKLVVFNDVDIDIAIERKIKDSQAPVLPLTVQAANIKTFMDIHDEIRKAQQEDVGKSNQSLKLFLLLPRFLEEFFMKLFWRRYFNNPFLRKKTGGTVMITAVGMFGSGIGWGLPIANHTLGVTLGGIGKKPGIVNNEIQIREYMSVTLSFDHDIVDGAPAARFIGNFKGLIEIGYGLE